jgi:Tripartite tricarboxylate transporter TctB family
MKEQTTRRRQDLFAGLGLSAAALLFAFTGGLITPANWLKPTQSPTVFPAGCLLGVAICGLIIARGSAASSSLGEASVSLRALGTGILMATYAVALPFIGLVVSTALLLVIVPLLFGYRNWLTIGLSCVLLVGGSWLIFIVLMGVPLKL